MAFTLHNYDEYLDINDVSNNLYDQCMFNGRASDSTFTTYMEAKKVTISNGVIRIAAVTNPKYPHTSLDHLDILNRNKEELQNGLCGLVCKSGKYPCGVAILKKDNLIVIGYSDKENPTEICRFRTFKIKKTENIIIMFPV